MHNYGPTSPILFYRFKKNSIFIIGIIASTSINRVFFLQINTKSNHINSNLRYLIRKGADKDACTIENLRPIDLVEPDNYIALSFLISTSENCNERHL